jgi:hypothetical protein
MKSRVLFSIFMVATAIAAERWWSPDRFYSIIPPAGWKHSESKTAAGSSYAFTSPDGQLEVRVSATYHLNMPDVLPEEVLELAFPNERGLVPIKRIRSKDGMVCDASTRMHSTRNTGLVWQHVVALQPCC